MNKTNLPIIDIFETALNPIKNYNQAIEQILNIKNTDVFDYQLNEFFENDEIIKKWKEEFNFELSQNMKNYQESYPDYDKDKLNEEIMKKGKIIPCGQYLFHGGLLNLEKNCEKILEKPFATTISPGNALFHSTIGSKAYDEGKIELLVLKVDNIKTKAIALFFTSFSHEREVLFASGIKLSCTEKNEKIGHFRVKNADGTLEKDVPVDVIICNIL